MTRLMVAAAQVSRGELHVEGPVKRSDELAMLGGMEYRKERVRSVFDWRRSS